MPGSNARERIGNVPNTVTALRLACIPVFCWLLFGAGDPLGAGIMLAALGATDWVDGFLARRLGQTTQFGAVFDPVVDRIMFLAAVVSMLVHGDVALWFGIGALVRDLGLSIGTLALASKKVGWLGVNRWGRTGSFGLMFAFPMFLIGSADIPGAGGWTVAGWVWGIPSLAIAWYGALLYVRAGREALARQRRAGESAPAGPES